MYGWKGKILRINLKEKKVVEEALPLEWMKKYMGCRGLATIIMYNEVGPEIDPMGPGNKLIFATGPLDGTPIGHGRVTVQCKHPDRYIGEGGFGGEWGPELKRAGYDLIVIEDKAAEPVYIFIDDHNVEIRDAKHLWGKDIRETNLLLEKETGINNVQFAAIGPAGENLVAHAKVQCANDHSGGRGCGTIMGDKKLKAIVVHGTGGVKIKDSTKFLNAYRVWRKETDPYDTNDVYNPVWCLLSANILLQIFNENGWLHAYNAQRGSVKGFFTGMDYMENYVEGGRGGYCCPYAACGRKYKIKEGKFAGHTGEEREGGFALVGAIVGLTSWPHMVELRDLCSRYGLDEYQVAYTIGWAMECYEKGILTKEDTDGIDLKWGDADVIVELTKKIALRDGFGDLLAKGSYHAAKILGKGSEEFLLTIKGRELEVMPQRGGYQMALCLAVSEGGPDHTRWYPPYPPNPKTIPSDIEPPYDPFLAFQQRNPEDKGRLVKWLYDSRAVLECLPTCVFTIRGIMGIDLKAYLDMFNAGTGLDYTYDEFLKVGERIVNLERAYIIREGFRREDDTIPKRMLNEPIVDRHLPPVGENMDRMLDDYYTNREWDLDTTIPKESKLLELDLDFVNEDMKKLR